MKTYSDMGEVVDCVNRHDRPLAMYPFSEDARVQQFYIDRIMSGGVTINNTLLHVAHHDLPFGGIGPSGMGHYHGHEGFLTFSKLRPVFRQGPIDALDLMRAPYRGWQMAFLKLMMRLKG